jgi:hypothetical protein
VSLLSYKADKYGEIVMALKNPAPALEGIFLGEEDDDTRHFLLHTECNSSFLTLCTTHVNNLKALIKWWLSLPSFLQQDRKWFMTRGKRQS